MTEQFFEPDTSHNEGLSHRSEDNFASLRGPANLCPEFRAKLEVLFERRIGEEISRLNPQDGPTRTEILVTLRFGLRRILNTDGQKIESRYGADIERAFRDVAVGLLHQYQQAEATAEQRGKKPLAPVVASCSAVLQHIVPEEVLTLDQLQRFAELQGLVNDGDEHYQRALLARRRREDGYAERLTLSRKSFARAEQLLEDMLHDAGENLSILKITLHGFQLELAQQSGNIDMFLEAVQALKSAEKDHRYGVQAQSCHCRIADCSPTLFNRHFEFTFSYPRNLYDTRQRVQRFHRLILAAHERMWRIAEEPITKPLENPAGLTSDSFKELVQKELQKAIEELNQRLAKRKVNIKITSIDMEEIEAKKLPQGSVWL